jgi:hypothetical protein
MALGYNLEYLIFVNKTLEKKFRKTYFSCVTGQRIA